MKKTLRKDLTKHTVSITFKFVEKVATAGKLEEVTNDTFKGDTHAENIAKNEAAVTATPLTKDSDGNYSMSVTAIEEDMTNWQSGENGQETGKWFALMLDLGLPFDRFKNETPDTNYKLKEADFTKATELGGTDTSFIVWLTTEYFTSNNKLVLKFKDIKTEKEITVTINYTKGTKTVSLSTKAAPVAIPVPETNEPKSEPVVIVPETDEVDETQEAADRTEIVVDAEEAKIPEEILVEE